MLVSHGDTALLTPNWLCHKSAKLNRLQTFTKLSISCLLLHMNNPPQTYEAPDSLGKFLMICHGCEESKTFHYRMYVECSRAVYTKLYFSYN